MASMITGLDSVQHRCSKVLMGRCVRQA